MKKSIFLLFFIFSLLNLHGQIAKQKAIDIAIGYGLSAPYDDFDVTGEGFYLQGEYVLTLQNWIDVRGYAGLILATTPDSDNISQGPNYRSDAQGGLFGVKTRIMAPIPWVAPYIEGGIGGSIGNFETFTPTTDLSKQGLLYHIPFALGLQIGPERNFDIGFTYYFHPSVEQFSGAVAIGITIPLKS